MVASGSAAAQATAPPGEGAPSLPTVSVTASGEPGVLPQPLPGGQLARGARLGQLGNVDVLTTPFSLKSYTTELIENQGARSVDDVVANDPSVRVSLSPGFVLDQSSIRGFVLFAGAYTIDGLPGLVSYSRIPVQNFERVEILKGPASALAGASISGTSVGGSINLVPKRAGARPVSSLGLAVWADSVLEAHVDLGRRFGPDGAFGVRLNVLAEKGELSTGTRRENVAPQIALDYTGERLRVNLDAARIDYTNRRHGVQFSMAPGQAVPAAPDGAPASQPRQAQQALDGYWALAGVEFDVAPQLTGFARHGKYHEESDDSFIATIGPLRGDGSFPVSNYGYNSWRTDQNTTELGLRGRFATGAVRHQATLSVLRHRQLYTSAPTGQVTPISTQAAVGSIYRDYAVPASYVNTRPALGAFTGRPIRQESVAIADSMTLLQERLNVVVALRQQKIEQDGPATAPAYSASELTPTLGVSYRLGASWAVYGNYAEQLSQGSVAPSGSANAGESLAPFVGTQREIGAKWNAGAYGATLAYFDIRQDSAFTDPADNVFKAAGEQRNRGLELDSFGEIARGVRLLGGVAYIDARQTRTLRGATDGRRAVGVPARNVNVGAEWDVGALPGVTLTGRLVHTGEAYVDAANTQRLPSWNRIDVGARYATQLQGRRLVLRAGINNLLDKAYWQSGGRNLFTAAEPRTWRLSASLDL